MELHTNVFGIYNDQWALLTAGTPEKFNTMTISWGGMGTMWFKPVVTVYVRKSRYTHEFLEAGDTFTLSFFPEEYKKDLGVLGSKSGRDGDKLALTSLTAKPVADTVGFREAARTLVCRKLYAQDMDVSAMPESIAADYADGDVHTMYIAEVLDIIEG